MSINHNETTLEVEELEAVVAPAFGLNHNETWAREEEVALDAETLEAVIAPAIYLNHNETLASDSLR